MHGVGLALRWGFLEQLLEHPNPHLPFVEVSPENYMGRGGYFSAMLSQIAERFPIIPHGLTLSIGGTDPFCEQYFSELRQFLKNAKAPWHSDHLCWSGTEEVFLHELLPLPQTRECVRYVIDRILYTQSQFDIPFALENITWYAPLCEPEMDEADFINEILFGSGAKLLLDLNNVYVNACNHGFDPLAFLSRLPLDRVVQIHVAGPQPWDDNDPGYHHKKNPDKAGLLVDTHGADVPDPVYHLLSWVIERTGPLPVILERDQQIPTLPILLEEVVRLRVYYDRAVTVYNNQLASS